MNNKEQAIKQAIASMRLDGIFVSSECVKKVIKKQSKESALKEKDKVYEKRLR